MRSDSRPQAVEFWERIAGTPDEEMVLSEIVTAPLLSDRIQALALVPNVASESHRARKVLVDLAANFEEPMELRRAAVETLSKMGQPVAVADSLLQTFKRILSVSKGRTVFRKPDGRILRQGEVRRITKTIRRYNRRRRMLRRQLHSSETIELMEMIVSSLTALGAESHLEQALEHGIDRAYGVSAARGLLSIAGELALQSVTAAFLVGGNRPFLYGIGQLLKPYGDAANAAMIEAVRKREAGNGLTAAVRFLGEQRCQDALEALALTAHSARSMGARCAAILSLGKLGSPEAIDMLVLLAKTERKKKILVSIERALTNAGANAVPKALFALKSVRSRRTQARLLKPVVQIGRRALEAMKDSLTGIPVVPVALELRMRQAPQSAEQIALFFSAARNPTPSKVALLLENSVRSTGHAIRKLPDAFRGRSLQTLIDQAARCFAELPLMQQLHAALALLLTGVQFGRSPCFYPIRT